MGILSATLLNAPMFRAESGPGNRGQSLASCLSRGNVELLQAATRLRELIVPGKSL
jgi:hypothetical protein